MSFLLRVFLLVVLLVGLFWLFREPIMDRLGQRARAEAGHAERSLRGLPDGVDLDTDRIAAELKRTGRVVRRKAAIALHKLDEATRDTRTTAKIKARLALDPDLSARDISVDTTDGRVTLAGRVDSPDDVARAIRLALEEQDVVEVSSTLQVRPERKGRGRPAPSRPGATSRRRRSPRRPRPRRRCPDFDARELAATPGPGQRPTDRPADGRASARCRPAEPRPDRG